MLACAMCVTVELGFFWLAVTMAAQQATGGGGSSSRTVALHSRTVGCFASGSSSSRRTVGI